MVVIREAKARDLAGIARIDAESYDEVKADPNLGITLRLKKPGGDAIRRWTGITAERMRKGEILYDVAEENGDVVGFCFVASKDVNSEASHVGILGIHVAKAHRGKGLGTMLIKHMLSRCAKRFDVVEVSVFKLNGRARKLYTRLGFRRWGVAPEYVKRGRKYIDLEYMYLKMHR